MRLVLDANVLIAAFVARGVCAELLEHSVREQGPVTSSEILEDVRRNLVGKVKVTAAQAGQTIRLLRTRLEVVAPVATWSATGTSRSSRRADSGASRAADAPGSGGTTILLLALCACVALSASASADDPWEFWPEGQLFVGLSSRTRVFLNAAYAKGKESDERSLDTAAYLDISLLPIGPRRRQALRSEDWQRNRYFWARVGYDRIFKFREAEGTPSVAEDRGILSLWGKFPLPAAVWVEGRARADLRWIGGDYSTRYRGRLEATREFFVLGHPVVPYLNVEWFYDTRYDGWARTLYQAGSEFTVGRHFRFELFLAQQTDRLPSVSRLNAFGVVAKGYF